MFQKRKKTDKVFFVLLLQRVFGDMCLLLSRGPSLCCFNENTHPRLLCTEPVILNVYGGSPGIDSKELIPPAFVAWRAGTITLFLLS